MQHLHDQVESRLVPTQTVAAFANRTAAESGMAIVNKGTKINFIFKAVMLEGYLYQPWEAGKSLGSFFFSSGHMCTEMDLLH